MPQPPLAGNNDKSWYFYNPQLVQQGKQSFARQWGRRKNEDDWRRANRSLLASSTPTETNEEAPISAPQKARRDSLSAQGLSPEEIDRRLAEDTEKPASDKPAEATTPTGPAADPLQREFYLAKVPFTAEQQKEAHQLIRDALIEAGIIEKDKLGDYALAESTFDRLIRNYPDFERLNEAYYHLFLLAKRKGDTAAADRYRQTLATHYPDYALTPVVNDPDFDRNSRYARELEDSLYASTYNAYRLGDAATVAANFARSTATYPQGANRPKFILVHALSRLGTAPRDTIAAELRTLATEYPKSDVAEMAAMIVRGIEMGRNLSPTSFDLGGLWSRRLSENSAATPEFRTGCGSAARGRPSTLGGQRRPLRFPHRLPHRILLRARLSADAHEGTEKTHPPQTPPPAQRHDRHRRQTRPPPPPFTTPRRNRPPPARKPMAGTQNLPPARRRPHPRPAARPQPPQTRRPRPRPPRRTQPLPPARPTAGLHLLQQSRQTPLPQPTRSPPPIRPPRPHHRRPLRRRKKAQPDYRLGKRQTTALIRLKTTRLN